MQSRPLRQEEMKGLLAEELRRGAVGKGIIRWRRCGPLLLRDRGKGIRRTINGRPSVSRRASVGSHTILTGPEPDSHPRRLLAT